jgi:hypothetical protein
VKSGKIEHKFDFEGIRLPRGSVSSFQPRWACHFTVPAERSIGMITPISRPNTPARWRAALERAHREGISVRQLAASGAWIATSATDPYTAYEVSVHRCTCKAAEFGFDPVCKHRAALRVQLGIPLTFDSISTEPEAISLAA